MWRNFFAHSNKYKWKSFNLIKDLIDKNPMFYSVILTQSPFKTQFGVWKFLTMFFTATVRTHKTENIANLIRFVLQIWNC